MLKDVLTYLNEKCFGKFSIGIKRLKKVEVKEKTRFSSLFSPKIWEVFFSGICQLMPKLYKFNKL